jgi:hypothetical protein
MFLVKRYKKKGDREQIKLDPCRLGRLQKQEVWSDEVLEDQQGKEMVLFTQRSSR